MPFDKKDYHPKWSLISYLIRTVRAKNTCEKCGLKNKQIIKRLDDGTYRLPFMSEWDAVHSRIKHKHSNMTESLKHFGLTKVVLTTAHLDHNKNNNRFNNLAALCQRCHLKHDAKQHAENRKYGRHWKRDQLSIEF